MPDFPVTNQGLAVATRGTPHVCVNTAPDICLLPDGTPKPFPNHIETKMLDVGKTETTFISGEPIWTKKGELGPPSEPAHEGVDGGQTSGTYRGKATPTSYSSDLNAEGEPVVRTTDTTSQNDGNTTGQVVHTTYYFGLFDPESMIEFCKAWRELMKNWSKLTREERLAAMEKAINARLEAAGVRPISLDSEKMDNPNTNGHFAWREWGIAINEDRLKDTATEAELVRLGNTVYHEGRHAEQLWNSARYIAGTTSTIHGGPTPQGAMGGMVATRGARTWDLWTQPYSYPWGTAFDAAGQPLGSGSAQGQMGRDVYDSIWGANSAHRNTTLRGLSDSGKQVRELTAELDALDALPTLTPEQQTQRADVVKRLATARQDQQKYYQGYRSLPEEKDAWDVGNAFGASC